MQCQVLGWPGGCHGNKPGIWGGACSGQPAPKTRIWKKTGDRAQAAGPTVPSFPAGTPTTYHPAPPQGKLVIFSQFLFLGVSLFPAHPSAAQRIFILLSFELSPSLTTWSERIAPSLFPVFGVRATLAAKAQGAASQFSRSLKVGGGERESGVGYPSQGVKEPNASPSPPPPPSAQCRLTTH